MSDFSFGFDRLGQLLDFRNCHLDSLVDAAAQNHRIGSGSDITQSFLDHGLSEDGGGGGAVASIIVGLGADFANELGACIFQMIFQFDFFGDGDAIIDDLRCAELLFQNDVATSRSKRDLDGVRHLVDTALESAAGLFCLDNLLSHICN